MDNIAALMQGFAVAATPINLLMALAGAFVGTIVGLLPGIGPINGVAILLPIAFAMKLPATSALILLAAVYMGCEYGGRIASILVNIPGDAGSVMTTLDGFPLARRPPSPRRSAHPSASCAPVLHPVVAGCARTSWRWIRCGQC